MSIFDNIKKSMGGGQSMAERALNSIADGVIIVDGNALIKFINPAAVTLVGGSSQEELINSSFLNLMKLEDGTAREVPDHLNPLKTSMQKNEPWASREYSLITQQGKKIPVAISLALAGGPDDDKIITFRNISAEIEQENEQMEFISTASHEMRTPVASIEGYLGLALNPQTATIDERAQKYLNEAHEASQHLGRLFRDLLDVTKLDDNRMKSHVQPVELRSEIQKISERHSASVQAKNITLVWGDGTTPQGTPEPLYVMADIDFLNEIADNLIENAIKYTPENGTMWINVRDDGNNSAVFSVSDTGIGIAPEDLKHIFQKFYRADNSDTRTIGGTGLGLYIVKKRTEAMNGRVWAESVFGKGSNFYVSLPRISTDEYNRQKQIAENLQAMQIVDGPAVSSTMGQSAMTAAAAMAAPAATTASAQPTAAPVVETQSVTDLPSDQLEAMKKAFAEKARNANASPPPPAS